MRTQVSTAETCRPKTYGTPRLFVYGSAKAMTLGGSINGPENQGSACNTGNDINKRSCRS